MATRHRERLILATAVISAVLLLLALPPFDDPYVWSEGPHFALAWHPPSAVNPGGMSVNWPILEGELALLAIAGVLWAVWRRRPHGYRFAEASVLSTGLLIAAGRILFPPCQFGMGQSNGYLIHHVAEQAMEVRLLDTELLCIAAGTVLALVAMQLVRMAKGRGSARASPLILLVALAAIVTTPVGAQVTVTPPRDPKLRAKLLKTVEVEQKARLSWIGWMQKHPSAQGTVKGEPAEVKRVRKLDAENRAWLKGVLDKQGWPGRSLVGDDGAHAAWLLAQHADEDRPFQGRCLELMRPAAEKGEASKLDLAYLTDRVLTGQGKKQVYGTQAKIKDGEVVFDPIEDEPNVDKRRAEVGMPSLAEYAKMMRQMYVGKPKN